MKKYLSRKIEQILYHFGYYSEEMVKMRVTIERYRMAMAICPDCDAKGCWTEARYTCFKCLHTYQEKDIVQAMRDKAIERLESLKAV